MVDDINSFFQFVSTTVCIDHEIRSVAFDDVRELTLNTFLGGTPCYSFTSDEATQLRTFSTSY